MRVHTSDKVAGEFDCVASDNEIEKLMCSASDLCCSV